MGQPARRLRKPTLIAYRGIANAVNTVSCYGRAK